MPLRSLGCWDRQRDCGQAGREARLRRGLQRGSLMARRSSGRGTLENCEDRMWQILKLWDVAAAGTE
jgi:hypothetical protein